MSSDNSKNSKTYSDDDVIQSIYSNKSNAYDLLNLVPNLLDRKAEQEYYNQLTEKNGLKVDNSKLSYYETIETLSNMGISQRVLFDKDQLSIYRKLKMTNFTELIKMHLSFLDMLKRMQTWLTENIAEFILLQMISLKLP